MGTTTNHRLTRAIVTAAITVGLAGLHSPAHALVSGDFNYYPDGDTVVISGWAPDTCPVGTLVIPSTIASKPVSRIDSTTFSGRTCFSLGNPTTSVSIPSSVTSIGERAFKIRLLLPHCHLQVDSQRLKLRRSQIPV